MRWPTSQPAIPIVIFQKLLNVDSAFVAVGGLEPPTLV